MDEKLSGIYIFHEESLNDFKWRLDSIYDPLDNKITWLTTCMEELKEDIATMEEQKAKEAAAWKSWKLTTSTDDPWMPSVNKEHYALIDINTKKLIDNRFAALEDKLHSFEERIGSSYYTMSNDLDALATRMDALQQEMDTIQRQLDFQEETSPSNDMMTQPSIDIQKATAPVISTSVDSNINPSIDDKHPSQSISIKDEIFSSIKMDNQWEEESLKKKLDEFYCTLDNNINWITKRSELMQKELDILREKEEYRQKKSLSNDTENTTLIDMKQQHNKRSSELKRRRKPSWKDGFTDTPADTVTQPGEATYTKEEVDK
ncbi:Uncharacterized protein Rs2_21458 [Raphanus sativus]|uniref:Uncharacterized protein LOC130512396 n=1 Tax=Raphanus sativus TaxID=3726 RepID=A0A9W3DRW6_RAPSA|nr:uncharacterized protein LOC130512396 [Raphanus sativus]KAJ4894664.1 Uncharacterized protein Rs2_21458 [Raphanus sativus]